MNTETKVALKELKARLREEFQAAGKQWTDAVDQMWAFGPRSNGPNILLNRVKGYNRPNIWSGLEESRVGKLRESDNSINNGFQMATLAGPLCNEPMRGVGFAVEGWDVVVPTDEFQGLSIQQANGHAASKNAGLPVDKTDLSQSIPDGASSLHNISPSTNDQNEPETHSTVNRQTTNGKEVQPGEEKAADSEEEETRSTTSSMLSGVSSKRSMQGPYSGQLMSTSKEAFRRAFQTQPQRLMVAIYTCTIQVTTEVLGEYHL